MPLRTAVRLDGIKSVYCPVCQKRERATKTIAHNIEEFRLLFPDEKVTKPRMAEWCGLENKDRGNRKKSGEILCVNRC